MCTIIILIPCFLTEFRSEFGYLYGVCIRNAIEDTEIYYTLDVGTQKTRECIGIYKSKAPHNATINPPTNSNWFSIKLVGEDFIVTKIVSSSQEIDQDKYKGVICFVYNYSKFLKSELLVRNWNKKYGPEDYFQTLAKYIQKRNVAHNTKCRNRIKIFPQYFLLCTILLVKHLCSFLLKLNPVLKYSSLCSHCKEFMDNVYWALNSINTEKRVSIRVGNYIVSTIFDIFVGVFILNWLMTQLTADSLPQLLLDTAEIVVNALMNLLKWIMGVPAGLKLNFDWSNMLGNFFMYHISLWWTFLVITKPVLDVTFTLFLILGKLGVTFQVSFLADLLALVSFHIYCIYVYAARLYNLQVLGLISLWRLFIGKKWNPLRERVDSCTYTSEQLFVGTLAFTILFFLLPTTVMYYIVFATLRVIFLTFSWVLKGVRQLVQSIPLYSSFLWILGGDSITSTVQLVVHPPSKKAALEEKSNESSLCHQITLSVVPSSSSWWETVRICKPNLTHRKGVQQESEMEWSRLLYNFFSGKLIYPV